MKQRILKLTIFLLLLVGVFPACKEKEELPEEEQEELPTEECKNLHRDNIIGQWKLIESFVSVNYSKTERTDYSNENIIFDFQEDNKLVITGNIVDSLSLFDDFQGGEHFYEFHALNNCDWGDPGPNLIIDKPELWSWEGHHFCTALLYEETMTIGNDGWKTKDDNYYRWHITLIKLNQ